MSSELPWSALMDEDGAGLLRGGDEAAEAEVHGFDGDFHPGRCGVATMSPLGSYADEAVLAGAHVR
jgi:hypothetical protein